MHRTLWTLGTAIMLLGAATGCTRLPFAPRTTDPKQTVLARPSFAPDASGRAGRAFDVGFAGSMVIRTLSAPHMMMPPTSLTRGIETGCGHDARTAASFNALI